MKKLLCVLLSILLCLSFTGCSGSSGYKYEDSASYAETEAPEPSVEGTSLQLENTNRKLIYHSTISAETKDYDQAKSQIDSLITKYNGYLSSSAFSGYSRSDDQERRSLDYTIRIPAGSLFEFLEELESAVHVVSSNTDMTDVTGDYVDSEARLSALQQEETRLLELLDQAANLEEVLQLEDRISEVRYQIENITSRLQVYDNEIAYSTVELSLRDVTEYTIRPSFGSRSWEAFTGGWNSFVNTLQELVIALLWMLPFLLVCGVIVFFVIFFVRRSGKKRRERYPITPASPGFVPGQTNLPPAPKEEPKGKV